MIMMDRNRKSTVIDLSQDNESDDPTYSPKAKRAPVTSPGKSPRRKKFAGPTIKSQATLTSFLMSPVKNASTGQPKLLQSTIDAFIKTEKADPESPPAAPIPSAFRYESPAQDDQLKQAIEASMSNRSDPKSAPHQPNSKSKKVLQLGFKSSVKPHLGGSPMASSSTTSLPPRGSEETFIFGGDHARNTMTEAKLYSRPRSAHENITPPLNRCESPSKRKFSELTHGNAQSHSLSNTDSCNSSPDPLQTLLCSPSAVSTIAVDRRPVTPDFTGTKTMPSSRHVPTKNNSSATSGYPSATTVQGSLEPSRMGKNMIEAKNTDSTPRSDDDDYEAQFIKYDPYEDIEELRNLKSQSKGQTLKKSGLVAPEPIAQTDIHECKNALGVSLASRIDSNLRPYLSRLGRDFLAHMGKWEGYKQFEGQLIHCGFTARETSILRSRITEFTGYQGSKFSDTDYIAHVRAQLLNSENSLHRCIEYAARYLPGRSTRDCYSYVEDCARGDPGPRDYLVVSTSDDTPAPPSRKLLWLQRELGVGRDRCSIGSESFRQLQHTFINTLHPWKVFKEGSSDILDLAWSPSGESFALGAATHNDVYNRPGNLTLGSITLSKTKMLHGHQEPRPEPIGAADPLLHSTVSGVGFSPTGLLYSAGYDGAVRVWHPEAGVELYSHKMIDRVVCLSVSPYHENVVAAGTGKGTLELLSFTEDGELNSNKECNFDKAPTEALYPSCLAWSSNFYNRLISGYDNQGGKTVNGSLVIYDATRGTMIQKVFPGSTKHYDLFTHSSGCFVTACAARNSRTGAKSNIRQFDMTDTGAVCILDVDSPQIDINRVTISPCGTFVTSSGTDGSTICWDTRFPEHILQKLQHGPTLMNVRENAVIELDDTGVQVALWGHNSDFLYTGSSDGIVKIWDLKKGDPFVKDLGQVNAQIMSGQFSPEKDMLLIGDASGTATLFSNLGDKHTPPAIFDTEGEVLPERVERSEADVPESQLARYYSEELIRQGRVVIGPDGCAWGA